MSTHRRYVVIGGGIVGLAVAERLIRDDPAASVSVLEKEDHWAAHQSGHNSGVIHSGLYYAPGSQKATMCQTGRRRMVELAQEEGIAHQTCGKLVVATQPAELGQLAALQERGRRNGLQVHRLTPAQASEIEPHVRCVGALQVPATGIIDYREVCAALVRRATGLGAQVHLRAQVVGVHHGPTSTRVEATTGDHDADVVVNCAGLHSDRVARLCGARPQARIVPFRGEYYELRPERRHLVRGLVYPVPDPAMPFLGVHLTRGVDSHVHAGPNAVLALAREGYRWRDVSPRDVAEAARTAGLWRLAARYYRAGAGEVWRSLSLRRFATSLRALVPEIRDEDLVPAPAGVRAQALTSDGTLVDDFLVQRQGRVIHVLNAPSPAATSALAIAEHVVGLLPQG